MHVNKDSCQQLFVKGQDLDITVITIISILWEYEEEDPELEVSL